MGTGSRSGRGVTMNTTPSAEEIKERVNLYLYLHSARTGCSGEIIIFYKICIVLSTEEFRWYILARNFEAKWRTAIKFRIRDMYWNNLLQ